jgi:MerR family mercuric resistance operon transcriptional regulator
VVNRIRFIKHVKALGFSLKEIRELLFLRIDSRGMSKEFRKRIESKIAQIDRRVKTLSKVRNALAQISRKAGKTLPSENILLDVFADTRV